MGLGDFWLQFNNGKKEQLNDTKHGVRKEQVDKKFHNLFDAYDANNDGTLEENEVQTIFGHLKNFAGDNVLDSAENLKAKSVFADQVNMQDVDFQGFVKSVSDATSNIISSEETKTSDGGKEIKTEYKDGTTETIAYYSNGDFKWKKIEKRFVKTTYEMILDGKRQELTEKQYNQALKKLNKKPQPQQKPKATFGIEGQNRIVFPQPTPSVEVKTTTNKWEEHTQEYSPRFIAEKLGVDINTDEGKKILERMSYLPKEALDQIKDGAELKDVIAQNDLPPNFDNISNVLELIYGVTLRNEEEYESSKQQREKILHQIQTVGIMSELYAKVAEYYDTYTDNQGVFGLGSEGIGWILNKIGIQSENHYQWADSCREFIEKINDFKVLNPAKFEEEFKGLTGKEKFNVEALQKMLELAKDGKAQDEYGDYTDEYKQAVKEFSNFDVTNINAKAWYHPDNLISGFGEALIMIGTLGYGAETKAGQMLATSTMATFGKAGVAIASKQVNNRLLQGALRLSGQGVKLLAPMINEGTKMYAYTAVMGTTSNIANRAIKFDSEENSLEKFLDTEAMVLDNAKGSFAFGAFAGAFGSTVTQKVMQRASRVSTKVGTALSDKFAKGAVDANEVFTTILEKSAPTKIAEVAAFATDVLGFTAFESVLAIVKNLDNFPDGYSVEDLTNIIWEELKNQGYNLGQIKIVAWLMSSRSARMQATRYMKDAMPQLRGATLEGVNGGKDGYKINLPDGRKIECKNTTEYISALQLMVRGETAFSGKFDARNTNRGTETSDVAILTTQGETIERRQVQPTNTELSKPDFAEISNDFAQNHKSYELYSDNDGNNVVMIVAVAGERPNPRAGIPFTYEVYRFDKDGNQISEPLKGLSEKEAKKYQLENKQFIDNRVSDNSSSLNSFIIPLPKKILESINDFINRNHEKYKYNKELKKLEIGGASEEFVAQQKEELLKAFSQAPKELQDEVRNATQADLSAKLKVAKLIEEKLCRYWYNGEHVTLENYERIKFNRFPDGNFVTKIIADTKADNVQEYLERINCGGISYESLPACYFSKHISLDNFKKMQSEGVDIRMSSQYVRGEDGEYTTEYDVTGYQKLFEQINDENIDFIINVGKRVKENNYTLDPKGYLNALEQLNKGDKNLIRENVDVVEFLACRDIKEQITSENLPILKAVSKNNKIGKEDIPKILNDVATDGQAKVIERLNTGLKYERAKYLSELTPEMKTIEDKLEGFDKLPEEVLSEKQAMIKNNKINRARKFLDEYPSIREDDKQNIIELLENTKTYEQFNARYNVFELHKEKMAEYSQEGNYWGPTHMVEFLNMIKIKEQAELINQTDIDLFTEYRTLNNNFGRTYINCSNHFDELKRSCSHWSSRNEIRKALGEAKFEDDILALKEGVSDEVLNNDNYSSLVTDPVFRDVYRKIKKCRDYTKEQELDIRAILRKPKTASEVLKSNPKLKSVKEISNQVRIETVRKRVQNLIEQFDTKNAPKMERYNSKESNLDVIEYTLKSFQNFDGVVENLSKYNTQTLELLQDVVRGLDESSFNEVSDILKNGDFSTLELRSGVDNLLEYFKRGLSTEHDRIYAKLMLMSDAEYRNTLIILSKRPEILTQKIDPATFDRLIKMSDSEYLDYITPESERPIKPIDIEAYRKEVLSSIDPDYKVDLSVYEQNVLAESSARDIGKFTARRSCSPDELRAETTRKAKESRQVHSVEEYIKEFEKTGNVTVTMQDRGGLKPEYTDDPIIKPEDVENLGIPQSADMTLGMGETRNWDNQRLARDLLQNFYDGNGFTLEGVEIKVEKQTNGKYKVRISGKGEFDYDRLVTLGFSGKRDLARSAGRHGEGAKVINGNLLCNKGTDTIEFGCGEWKLTLTKSDKAFDPNNKNATTPVMKTLTKNETKVEGNYMEFETTDPEFVKSIIKAKDFYYNAENTDFINPDVDNEFMTVKFHDNYREGNLYVIQRYEVEGSQGFDNALPGVSIAFKVNPEHPQIIKNNYGQKLTLSSGRNRVGLTEEKVTELIRAYGKTLTDEQLTNIIGHMEDAFRVQGGLFGYDLSARTPMQFILKGFLDVIKDRHLKIDFENRDYVAVPEGTTQSELEFVLKLGKTPVIGEMQSAGVPEIGVYMREVEAKRVPIVNITEVEKAKIQLLDKATQLFSENLDLDESSIITSRESSSPKYVFEKVGNDNYAAGEAILSGNSYKAHWVERNYLNNNSFYDILATWLHEISHKTGGDGSYSFVERLEKLEELITKINMKNPNFSKQLSVIAEEYKKLSGIAIDISTDNNKEFDITNYEHQIEMLMKHIEFHKDDYVEKEVETTEKNPEFHINNPLADSKKVKKGENEREFIHPEKNIEVRGEKVISGDIPGSSREFTTDIIATSNLKTLKETGRLSVELPKPNGINPVKGSTKIAETDRALLGQAKKTNMLLSYNQYQEWTYEMAARDIYQNFYDGHGGTLDGVKLEIVKQPNGKYKVKLSGESEYNYFYLQYTSASTKPSTDCAGGFGEGAKMSSRALLRSEAIDKITFGSGDWSMDFTRQEGVPIDNAFMMRTLRENSVPPDGTFVEFETDNLNLIEAMIRAKDYFEHSENPDFQDLDYKNKAFAYKVLSPGERGNLYYLQRFAISTDGELEGALNGLELIFNEKISREDLKKLKLNDDCDRLGFTPKEMRKIADYYAKSMSDEELMQTISDLEHFIYTDRENAPHLNSPEAQFVFGLIDNACKRESRPYFDDESKFVCLQQGTDPEDIDFAQKHGYVVLPNEAMRLGFSNVGRIVSLHKEVQSSTKGVVEMQKIGLLEEALYAFGIDRKIETFDYKSSEGDVRSWANGDKFYVNLDYLKKVDFYTILNQLLCKSVYASDRISYGYNLTTLLGKHFKTFVNSPQTREKLQCIEQQYNNIE